MIKQFTTKKALVIIAILVISGLAIYGWLLPEQIQLPGFSPTPTVAQPAPTNVQDIIVTNPQRDYEIVYEPQEDLYIISILKDDFENIRPIAEQDLITKLGLSPEEACSLKVTITSPFYASPEKQQVYNKFSFCP